MPGRTLDHAELFRLFCREAVRDGPRTAEDGELLRDLKDLLRLDSDLAARMLERAPPPGPGEARPLDRRRAFQAACRLAWEDGELETPERNLLTGLAQFLGLPSEEAAEMLTAAVHSPGGAGAPPPASSIPEAREAPELLGVEEETPLTQAARGLSAEAIAAALADGSSVAERGQHDWTPLHWVCRHASESPEAAVAAARVLLEAGAEVGAPERRGRRPLHLAARSGEVELVEALLEAGADKGDREWENSWSALHLAARGDAGDVIRMLLERGASVDERDAAGATALHRAAENGAGEAVRVLLEMGADLGATSMEGATPLHLARGGGHFEAAVHLEAREAPDLNGPDGLRAGSDAGDPVALFMMSQASADPQVGQSYLERAWEGGFPEAGLLLGRLWLRGEAGAPDPARARQYLEAAAAAGHAPALVELARLAREREPEREAQLLRRAAEQGAASAMRRLAETLDGPAATMWLRWAAAHGDRGAQAALAAEAPG